MRTLLKGMTSFDMIPVPWSLFCVSLLAISNLDRIHLTPVSSDEKLSRHLW